MEPHHIDITGKRFGLLVAVKRSGTWKASPSAKNGGGCKKAIWECKCDCGAIVNVKGTKLRNGRTQSCGCAISPRSIRIGGKHFGSYLEAAYFLELKERGVVFLHDKKYPNSRMRFDFHVPSENRYVEVSSFDPSFRGWEKYAAKIEAKRRLVEDTIGGKFEFVNRKVTDREQRAVFAAMDGPVPKVPMRHNKPRSYWAGMDWSKNDVELAAESGCSLSTVGLKRKKFAPNGCKAWDITMMARWAGVDWSLGNRRLAKILGKTVGAVRVARKRASVWAGGYPGSKLKKYVFP